MRQLFAKKFWLNSLWQRIARNFGEEAKESIRHCGLQCKLHIKQPLNCKSLFLFSSKLFSRLLTRWLFASLNALDSFSNLKQLQKFYLKFPNWKSLNSDES